MSLKSLIKAVTPPILWIALRHLRHGSPPIAIENEPTPDHIAFGYVRALETRFPKLLEFGLPVTPVNAGAVVDFYAEIIPLIHAPAKPAHIRNALFRLSQKAGASGLQAAIRSNIAIIELEAHNPDRATALMNHADLGPKLKAELDKMEAAYGAPLISQEWPGAERGATLIHYFSNHRSLLRDKRILHMAAEEDLSGWIRQNANAASYTTSDAYGDADEAQDITAITHADNSFDVVICHRVMEHVLDDRRGFSELYRILKPGGFVSFSVPQAAHSPVTAEWCIPDLTHHGHVRHYGADLEDRIKEAGFEVELVRWLLERDPTELRALSAFPMRIYHLHKPPRAS